MVILFTYPYMENLSEITITSMHGAARVVHSDPALLAPSLIKMVGGLTPVSFPREDSDGRVVHMFRDKHTYFGEIRLMGGYAELVYRDTGLPFMTLEYKADGRVTHFTKVRPSIAEIVDALQGHFKYKFNWGKAKWVTGKIPFTTPDGKAGNVLLNMKHTGTIPGVIKVGKEGVKAFVITTHGKIASA